MTHRSFCASLLGLVAVFTVLAVPTLAAPLSTSTSTTASDLDAAYKAALPLYKDTNAKPPTVTVSSTGTAGTGTEIHFTYTGDGGETVPALLFLPPGASKSHPVPCVIILHGRGGNIERMTPIALDAMKQGYASLAVEEYNQGSRVGVGVAENGDRFGTLSTAIQHSAVDVRRGIDYLDTRSDIDHRHIGLMGISLGAIIGAVTAGVEPRIQCVVLISGGGNWALILKSLSSAGRLSPRRNLRSMPGADWAQLGKMLVGVDPATFAPHIAPRPILMEHGRQDTIIDPAAAQALYDSASKPANSHVHIDWFPNAGHVPSWTLTEPNIQPFLAKNL